MAFPPSMAERRRTGSTVRGVATLDVHGSDQDAEVHWFQEKTAGKRKFKVKEWKE